MCPAEPQRYRYPDARILVMAKAPLPGQVKTRLAPLLGEEGAAAFLTEQLRSLGRMLQESRLAPVQLWAGLTTRHPLFDELRQAHGWPVRAQQGADLGARMQHAAARALAGSRVVILIGADCPALDAAYLDAALAAMQEGLDAVIGPAADGGYVLLGLRAASPELFDGIDWSTPQVGAQTRMRMRELGWRWRELASLRDIDTPADYRAWRRQCHPEG